MRFLLLFCGLLCVSSNLPAQDRKDLAISVSGGVFNSPYYGNAHAGSFYGLGFNYHLRKRHVLSANYLMGKHTYFDDKMSNTPANIFLRLPDGTNADAEYNLFSVGYKYSVVSYKNFTVQPGVGAGILTKQRTYPYSTPTSTTFYTSAWSDLVFPITLNVHYTVFKHWQLGLTSGFLIHPDYPILGLHLGPRIAYVVK